MRTRDKIRAAKRFGKELANDRVGWLLQELPGGGRNTSRSERGDARRLLEGIEEGDYRVMDSLSPRSLFAHEYGDDPTLSDLQDTLEIDPDGEWAGEEIDEYASIAEGAYDSEWWRQVERQLHAAAKRPYCVESHPRDTYGRFLVWPTIYA